MSGVQRVVVVSEEVDVRVRNLNGSRDIGNGADLLAIWERISGRNAYLCSVRDCINRPSKGGLVQKEGREDRGWYVIPLCKDCNTQTGRDLDIWDLVILVSSGDMGAQRTVPRSRQGISFRSPGLAR